MPTTRRERERKQVFFLLSGVGEIRSRDKALRLKKDFSQQRWGKNTSSTKKERSSRKKKSCKHFWRRSHPTRRKKRLNAEGKRNKASKKKTLSRRY